MSTNERVKEFDLMEEIEKTVTQSLITSFGLDFILLEDKHGGDVDTIHNARAGVYATDEEKKRYENRESYDGHQYHSHSNYINKGRADKKLQREGKLYDTYRDQNFSTHEKRDLDHIIAASEIHHDPARILAEMSGVELANQDSNFQSTSASINRQKKAETVTDFIQKLPERKTKFAEKIQKNQQKLQNNSLNDIEREKLKSKIEKDQKKLEALESINSKEMLAADKLAREDYNRKISSTYYQSSKFLKNTGQAALHKGMQMGARQALGIICAELWFEMKESLPVIFQKHKNNFSLQAFLTDIANTLQNLWERVKKRFQDLISSFFDGSLSGALSSLTTTLVNTIFTTTKMIGKLIREMWQSLVQAVKLIFFNPDHLSPAELTKEVLRIIGTGVSVFLGTIIYGHLAPMFSFPFGDALAAFLSALASGILMIGLSYFLDHSEVMKKVWRFLENFEDKYDKTLKYFQEVNQRLDEYLLQLSRIEFNMSPLELKVFADSLETSSSELERSFILKEEVERRNIDLPFQVGDADSTRNWLASLCQK